MNNWNFNEVTQQDLYDFKACKHNKTGEIYGIKDTSSCQSGKEVTKDEIAALARKANGGDAKAKATLKKYQDSVKKVDEQSKKERLAAEKKKAEEGGKGKKGKGKGKGKKGGGKGKKGGGKGKGGKGGKGGGGSSQGGGRQVESREAKVKRFRSTVDQLQKLMKRVTDPKQRERLQQRINDVLKSVLDMAPQGTEGAQVAQQAKQSLEKKES